MLRLLVLIGAFFVLRAMLPRKSGRSPTATSPYMNGLDGIIPAQHLSSVLDEVTSYQSWVISQRSDPGTDAQIEHLASSTPK
jgi:hypothetical protein